MLYQVVLNFESEDEILKCDHSNESNWAVLACVLSIMLYKVVLTLESVDEILQCDHSNESYWAVLSLGALHFPILFHWKFRKFLSKLYHGCSLQKIQGSSTLDGNYDDHLLSSDQSSHEMQLITQCRGVKDQVSCAAAGSCLKGALQLSHLTLKTIERFLSFPNGTLAFLQSSASVALRQTFWLVFGNFLTSF